MFALYLVSIVLCGAVYLLHMTEHDKQNPHDKNKNKDKLVAFVFAVIPVFNLLVALYLIYQLLQQSKKFKDWLNK
jgi:uncharacterized membrane protein